ncbi:MAG: FumA C-terminus/TtdB family hydratase beta subunit [Methanomicrobiales archaeon]|nr:FumA C-terminus/TtdB family hydratase beta subunit [Methanomicrobiales archaeon]
MLGIAAGHGGGVPVNVVALRTPLGDEVLSLRAGDRVTLSGRVYTARDEAHLMMEERGVPFDPQGAAIYHCGPIIINGRVIAAGPTTSARMNNLSGPLLDKGVRALVGKGGMGETVRGQLKGRGVYLAFTGGCAALAASCMKYHNIYYEELGMAEAVWELEFDTVPLVVGIDSRGNDLFHDVSCKAKLQFSSLFR